MRKWEGFSGRVIGGDGGRGTVLSFSCLGVVFKRKTRGRVVFKGRNGVWEVSGRRSVDSYRWGEMRVV